MATATSTKPSLKALGRQSGPLERWHLLSLDAPTIATLWTWFIASANHIQLPFSSTLSMAITVWMLYAADRLMDSRLLSSDQTLDLDLEARHYFHYRHRSAFLVTIVGAAIVLAALLPHLETEALRLYLILGSLVIGYFIVIHATRSAHRFPKEIAVGIFFAAAVFIPTIARRPDLRLPLLPFALLFAVLCSLNCLFIYTWEHDGFFNGSTPHRITSWAIRNLPTLTVLLTLAGAAVALFDQRASWPIPYAIALSAALLLLLHNHRLAIAPVTLRAAADLALTTPLLLVLFLRQ
ncbi:MAG TPA: hypothetical protein VNU92_01170 [Edaphobacter sp.]|nr:hypothetical protein [Edaphobacter sp.]